MTTCPYVCMHYSPALQGKARQFGGHYSGVRVVETTNGLRPSSSRDSTVVRVVRDRGGLSCGKTERSAGYRERLFCEALAKHLNLLHQVRRGTRRVTLANIADETNSEMQRELIELYDGCGGGIAVRARGWDTYLADVKADTLHSDEAGTLIEIATAAEPIRVVRVTCPSTGRQYALRVPPRTETARAGVAWTFGLTAGQYQPSIQS